MKGYSSRDVARLLGLTVAQVRGFARDGCLTPAPGRGAHRKLQFSFQDLVILRAAKALVAARIPARRIRRALQNLRQQLPRGRTLAALPLVAEGDGIVASDGTTAGTPGTAHQLEDLAQPADAIEDHRRALVVEPRLAAAQYNVARLYEKVGKKAAARRHPSSYARLTAGP